MNKNNKLRGVFNIFSELKEKLNEIKETKNNIIVKSDNLFYFEEYLETYVKLHYEIIKKYDIYRILRDKGFTEEEFKEGINLLFPYFSEIAEELFPEKSQIINYFLEHTYETKKNLKKVFNKKESIRNYIKDYTAESFFYKYINKFLREGDFNSFRVLSSYISKFIYHLSMYEINNKDSVGIYTDKTFYRKLILPKDCINIYKSSINKVICFPSFTSTSIKKNAFSPNKPQEKNEIFILLNIYYKYNGGESPCVCIKEYSDYQKEEEYLFPPFSFFKIEKVEDGKGIETDPTIIYLNVVRHKESIEKMFLRFFDEKTDNLSPEGLDLLCYDNKKNEIYFNQEYNNIC